MRAAQKRIARGILTVVLICSCAVLAWNAYSLIRNGGRILIAASKSEAQSALISLTSRNLSQSSLESRLRQEIQSDTRNWIVIDSLSAISEENGFALAPILTEEMDQARHADNGLFESATACAKCVINYTACDLNASMTCGLAVQLTPIGDVLGISNAGVSYVQGKPVDQIDVALSTVGLVATAIALSSGGSSLSIKAGSSLLKFAHVTGNIPPKIARSLKAASRDGINWAKLPSVRGLDDLKAIIHREKLEPVADLASSLGFMAVKSNPRQTLYLLKGSKDIAEVKQVAAVVEVLNEQTTGYFALLGRSKVLRATMRIANEVYGLIVGLLGLLSSIFVATITSVFRQFIKKLKALVKEDI